MKKKIQENHTVKSNMIRNRFFNKLNIWQKLFSKKILGLDIGPHSLQFVYIGKYKHKVEIKSWGKEDFPKNTDRVKSFAITINKILKNKKLKTKHLIISLSGKDITSRHFIIPKMDSKKLESAIFYKLKNEMPTFNNDSTWNYSIIREISRNNSSEIHVLVTIAENEELESYLSILKSDGIEPWRVISKSVAVETSYKKMIPHPDTDIYLEISDTSTFLSLLLDGKIGYTRNIVLGKETIENELRKEIKKIEIQTKKKLINLGKKPELNDKINHKIREICEKSNPAINSFIGEIQKSLVYIKNEFGIDQIKNIYVSGSGLSDTGLMNSIGQHLKIKLKSFYPLFRKINNHEKFFDHTAILGTALYDHEYDLTPKIFTSNRKYIRFLRWAYLLGFLACVTLGLYSHDQYLKYQNRKQAFELKKEVIQQLNQAFMDHDKRLDSLKTAWNSYKEMILKGNWDYSSVSILKLVSNILPEGLGINYFKMDPAIPTENKFTNIKATLVCETYKNEYLWDNMVPSFMENLKATHLFDKVILANSEFSKEDNKGAFTVKLIINLDYGILKTAKY